MRGARFAGPTFAQSGTVLWQILPTWTGIERTNSLGICRVNIGPHMTIARPKTNFATQIVTNGIPASSMFPIVTAPAVIAP